MPEATDFFSITTQQNRTVLNKPGLQEVYFIAQKQRPAMAGRSENLIRY